MKNARAFQPLRGILLRYVIYGASISCLVLGMLLMRPVRAIATTTVRPRRSEQTSKYIKNQTPPPSSPHALLELLSDNYKSGATVSLTSLREGVNHRNGNQRHVGLNIGLSSLLR